VPHSGYHRIVGFPRPFFEGWYFRVTLPETRDNLSLIYHVYDPDLTSSTRRGAGAQACTPGGGYIYRESSDVDAFSGDPHALALRMTLGGGGDGDGGGGGGGTADEEFFEITDDGRRHRGRLSKSKSSAGPLEDHSVWPREKCVSEARWDIAVRPVLGYGGRADDVDNVSLAGWLSSLPVFEPHYQVTMAHGLASGWIEHDGARTEFTNAPAYSEKNWGGAGFPSRWFWCQCNAFHGAPGLSVTATGGNRGVVLLPGVREEVAAVLVHLPDGSFLPFAPVTGAGGSPAAEVIWDVDTWGRWRVTAKTPTREVVVKADTAEDAGVVGKTTVLRAPMDDVDKGMAPLCRESFRGRMSMSMWKLDPSTGARVETLLDDVRSDVAAVEVGGGPWSEPWRGTARMREPLGTLAGADVDVNAIASFLRLDVPGL